MNNVKINYNKIVAKIQNQFDLLRLTLKETDPFCKNLKIYVEDEQMFIKHTELDPNAMYIVVKFSSASFNFAASVTSVSLLAFSTDNRVKPTQSFLQAFCSTYNLNNMVVPEGEVGQTIQQIWTTPNVSSNFVAFYNAFRSIVTLSGYLVIGQDIVSIGSLKYIYGSGENDNETINILSFSSQLNNSLEPQPYGNTFGFTKSEVNFSTYGFTISTYAMDSKLVRDCLEIEHFRMPLQEESTTPTYKQPNDKLKLILTLSNGYTNNVVEGTNNDFFQLFKVSSVNYSYNLGDIPKITISFTR